MGEVPYQELYPMGGSAPETLPKMKQERKAKAFPTEILNKLPRCPYRQDLLLACFEAKCDEVGCPIFAKESGRLAESIEEARQP